MSTKFDEAVKQLQLAREAGHERARDAARSQLEWARRTHVRRPNKQAAADAVGAPAQQAKLLIRTRGAKLEVDGEVRVTRIERNSKCPCGSGAKFKRCCG